MRARTPERSWISFTVDGREAQAPENELLVNAMKRADVEIPFFCYERKLGPPVGACRMCMVEVEGMPKLQTSCSTPVKDGMVVHTQTDRVKEAQNAIVEFLLVNHPLDCPVCDKGGECPLQDIAYGWGPGRGRFVEPKRHFPKPLALSPLVAIDRERCILCYRCVRFSQEISEDHQLAFLERGDRTFVGTFNGRPYVAPFAGNIIELCPVGALTSTAYRFRARPWEIEGSGSICTLCPSQCNITFTVRDERVERVLARDNSEVDDGWLCDKGRWGYQTIRSEERVVKPLIRDGDALQPASWEQALDAAAEGLHQAGAASAAIVGGSATNEEGHLLQRIFREALMSPNVDSRTAGVLEPDTARLLARPELSMRVSDLEQSSVVMVLECDPINESPILDLRVRKAVRRAGARLVVATSYPTALDDEAAVRLPFAPGAGEALLRALQKAMVEVHRERPAGRMAENGGELEGRARLLDFLDRQSLDGLAELAGAHTQAVRDIAALLTGAEGIAVVWGERLADGEQGASALRALTDLALLAGLDGGDTSGLLEVPAQANGRGLREVGCLPNLGSGLAAVEAGLGGAAARDAGARGEIRAYYLLQADPLREHPHRAAWERALHASFVVVHEQFLSESAARYADVVLPAESYAEKEGTVTHADGRLQRLRPAVGHPGEVRFDWQVLAGLAGRLGLDIPHATAGAVLAEIAECVPFYRGITLDEIGGDGVRWQEREASLAAAKNVLGELRFSAPSAPPALPADINGSLRLSGRPSLWASRDTDHSPSLRFLAPGQQLELHPTDAERLGVAPGDGVQVASNGRAVHATVRLRSGARPGFAYLIEGTAEHNANLLSDGASPPVTVRRATSVDTDT